MTKSNASGLLLTFCKAIIPAFLTLGMAGCGGKNYSHTEFTSLVMGKTEAEVKSSLGDPSMVPQGAPKTWVYIHRTYDVSKKDDYKASLTFAKDPTTGKDVVVNVAYSATAA